MDKEVCSKVLIKKATKTTEMNSGEGQCRFRNYESIAHPIFVVKQKCVKIEETNKMA